MKTAVLVICAIGCLQIVGVGGSVDSGSGSGQAPNKASAAIVDDETGFFHRSQTLIPRKTYFRNNSLYYYFGRYSKFNDKVSALMLKVFRTEYRSGENFAKEMA
ncbi:hypothetical protein ACI65C_005965 [Semiaphis heraclei]